MKSLPDIVQRNKDVEHIMHAACRYGYNTSGKENVNKRIAILVTADNWQNYCSDLPRAKGTKAEDCLTVLSLDTENRRINLVRIGSNVTVNLDERTYTALPY